MGWTFQTVIAVAVLVVAPVVAVVAFATGDQDAGWGALLTLGGGLAYLLISVYEFYKRPWEK